MSDGRKVAKTCSCDVGEVQESNTLSASGLDVDSGINLHLPADLTTCFVIIIEDVHPSICRLAVSFTKMLKSLETLFITERENLIKPV